MDRLRASISALDERAALPRKNGELVFEAPWESRAFGMALALHSEGAFTWEEFSERLGRELAADGGSASTAQVLPVAPDTESDYYEHWLHALESLVREKGLLTHDELDGRTEEFAAGKWDHH